MGAVVLDLMSSWACHLPEKLTSGDRLLIKRS